MNRRNILRSLLASAVAGNGLVESADVECAARPLLIKVRLPIGSSIESAVSAKRTVSRLLADTELAGVPIITIRGDADIEIVDDPRAT